MDGLIRYVELPTRLRHLTNVVAEIVRSWGDAPIVPFNAGPFEDLEGNPKLGDLEKRRRKTLRLMVCLKNGCDADALFGISDGTMHELEDTLDLRDRGIERDVRVYYGLDPEWEKYYEELKPKYGDLFARLRGPNYLIALVGPRAIGKTFWSEYLLKLFPEKLQRVKNTTTRDMRKGTPEEEKRDCESYNFVSREEFEKGIQENRFLEHDNKYGNYYGSSIEEIKKVLKKSSGIFAITPPGAMALYERRFEINLKIIRMVPETTEVLKKNYLRRPDLSDAEKQKNLLAEANQFTLPAEINHESICITGGSKLDQEKLRSIVSPLINQ